MSCSASSLALNVLNNVFSDGPWTVCQRPAQSIAVSGNTFDGAALLSTGPVGWTSTCNTGTTPAQSCDDEMRRQLSVLEAAVTEQCGQRSWAASARNTSTPADNVVQSYGYCNIATGTASSTHPNTPTRTDVRSQSWSLSNSENATVTQPTASTSATPSVTVSRSRMVSGTRSELNTTTATLPIPGPRRNTVLRSQGGNCP